MSATASARVVGPRADSDPARGFSGPRDFLASVLRARHARDRDSVSDDRLRALAVREFGSGVGDLAFVLPLAYTPGTLRAAAGSDEQGTYADPYGGFSVPSSVAPFALGAVEADPSAGRTMAIPMDTSRLSVTTRVGTSHSTSVTGGLEITRTPETVSRASTRMAMESVPLDASSLFGFSWATEEVVDSPAAFIAILTAAYRDEMASTIFREKLTGSGAGEYEGVTNAACKIEVAKESGQAAGTIVGANVVSMRRRCWGYERAIWLANHDTYEQVAATHIATGAGPKFLFVESDDEARPDFLSGRPCFFTEHLPALGNAGDLVLVNWSQYLEGVYQPFTTAESVHVRFEQHERAFKFWTRNAGAPWWRAPLTPENGANTLSPIVTLAERA